MTPELALWGVVGYLLGRLGIAIWFYYDPLRHRTPWKRLSERHFRNVYTAEMLTDDVRRIVRR